MNIHSSYNILHLRFISQQSHDSTRQKATNPRNLRQSSRNERISPYLLCKQYLQPSIDALNTSMYNNKNQDPSSTTTQIQIQNRRTKKGTQLYQFIVGKKKKNPLGTTIWETENNHLESLIRKTQDLPTIHHKTKKYLYQKGYTQENPNVPKKQTTKRKCG